MAIDTEINDREDGCLGGGLYRPFRFSVFKDRPSFVIGRVNTEPMQSQYGRPLGGRMVYPNGEQRYIGLGVSLNGLTVSNVSNPAIYGIPGGGHVIYPAILATMVDSNCPVGTLYNVWQVLGIDYGNLGANGSLPMTHDVMVINAIQYMVPGNDSIWADNTQGFATVFQISDLS